ncbi:MAG: hypothetical protein ACO1N0_12095 [Fluviicola sp.]
MKTSGKIERMELLDDDEFSLGEIPKKDKKKKKQKVNSDSGTIKGILAGFNKREAKNSVPNTLLKLLADIAGVGIGTVLSASAGKAAPAVGVALLGAGHYMGDESGLLRVVGASTLSHSVAKGKEYREKSNMSISERLKDVKDGWLHAFLLKKYQEEQNSTVVKAIAPTSESSAEETGLEGIEPDDPEEEFLEESSEEFYHDEPEPKRIELRDDDLPDLSLM